MTNWLVTESYTHEKKLFKGSNAINLVKTQSVDIDDGVGRDMADMLYIHIVGATNCSSIVFR